MAEMKHTPGPWFAARSQGRGVLSVHSETTWICGEIENHIASKEAWANAHLIAASPELRDALDRLLARYVGLVESGDAGFWNAEEEDEVIAARAALAKAEGQ